MSRRQFHFFLIVIICLFIYQKRMHGLSHLGLLDQVRYNFNHYSYRLQALISSAIATDETKPTYDPNYDHLLRWTSFDLANYIKYSPHISRAANKHNLDPDLVRAVIMVESRFKVDAISPKGATGLMQLMPLTALDYGVTNIFDPEENIQAGSRYLRYLLDLFKGDLRLSLAGYNAGPGAVKQYNGIPPFPETQDYVKKVISAYRVIQRKKV